MKKNISDRIRFIFSLVTFFCWFLTGVSFAFDDYDPEKILQVPHQSILNNESLPQATDNTGALVNRIPIKVAPGRGGHQPELALVYNSQNNQNSWVGVGWTLDMGSIQRSSKQRINFDNNDAFSHSGNDLVKRTDWGSNYYGAKIEKAFSKYKFNGDTSGWEVFQSDGRRYYFGTSNESKIKNPDNSTFRWLLDKIVDANGNTINIDYTNYGDEVYLDEVSYSPSGTRIDFILENRTDIYPVYSNFTKIEQTKRLKEIRVYGAGSNAHKYLLSYDYGHFGRLQLKSVREYGSNFSSTTFPATTFTYESGQNFDFENSQQLTLQALNDLGLTRFADVNGDGFTDMVKFHASGRTIWTYLGKASGSYSSYVSTTSQSNPNAGYILFGDINGDGREDLLKGYTGVGGVKMEVYHANSSTDGSFNYKGLLSLNYKTTPGMAQLADVNGDGLADLIEFPSTTSTIYTHIADPGSGSYFQDPVTGSLSGSANENGRIFIADLNGDGMGDVVKTTLTGSIRSYLSNGDGTFGSSGNYDAITNTGYTADPGRVSFADLNGDGFSDLVLTPFGSNVCTFFSDGSGEFIAAKVNSSQQTVNEKGYVNLADINGDGFADLIKLNDRLVSYYLGDKEGGFDFDDDFLSDSIGFGAVLDINGDKCADLLRFQDNSTLFYTHLSNGYPSTTDIPDLLVKIDNGYNVTSTIVYKLSTSYNDVHNKSSSYPNAYLPYVTHFVHSVTVNDGIGNSNIKNSYDYEGAHFDIDEMEFLGLGKVVKTNPNATTITTQYRTDSYYFKGCRSSSKYDDNNGSDYVNTTTAWATYNLQNNAKWVRRSSESNSLKIGGSTVSSNFSFGYGYDSGDDFGYLSTLTRSGTGGSNYVEKTIYDNEGAGGEWIIRLTNKEILEGSTTARKNHYAYDGDGNLRYETHYNNNGSDAVTERTYDTYGNVSSQIDPNNNTTSYTYSSGTYLSQENFEGLATTYANHNQWGLPGQKTDENNQVTVYTYDNYGRLTKEDYPGSGYKSISFTDTSRPRKTVSSIYDGSATKIDTYEYFDGLDRPLQSTTRGENGNHRCQRHYYDGAGRKWRTAGPFFTTNFSYSSSFPAGVAYRQVASFDFLDRPESIKAPHDDGSIATTTISYSGFNRTVTDPDTRSTTEKRDYLGRIHTIVDANQVSTTYDYNGAGDLTSVTGPLGNNIYLTHNWLGQVTQLTDSNLGIWTYTYKPNGEIETQTDEKGQVITYDYDTRNRLTSKIYTSSFVTEPEVTYTYDTGINGNGRLYSVTKDGVVTKHDAYDEMGRLEAKSVTLDAHEYVIEQTWNPAGNLSSITYPDGYLVTYNYHDGTGLLSSVTGAGLDVSFSNYEPFGRFESVTYPGLDASIDYFALTGRIDTHTVPGLLDFDYSYTKAGDVETINDQVRNTYAIYTYDKLHRLEKESITGMFNNPGETTIDLAYNLPQPHAVGQVTVDDSSYQLEYEENGNLTKGYDFSKNGSVPERTITYNVENKPLTIEYGLPGQTETTSFTYDGVGRRVKKETGSATTLYVDPVYEIKDGTPVKHIFASNLRLAKITGGNTLYFHKDRIGSSMVLSDSSGALVNSMSYMPFGSERGFLCGTDNNSLAYTFTDQEWDNETGLYNYDARLYDPVLGRFLSADSVVPNWHDPQMLDRYAYVRNNPLRYTDPTGHFLESGWDVANVMMDVASLSANVYSGNYWGAVADLGALIIDGAATVAPGVPAGAGATLKAMRAGDKVIDGVKSGKKVAEASKGTLTKAEIKAARQRGVNRAKSAERKLVESGHPGTADEGWSWAERKQIAETGQYPTDTRWHHINDVKRNNALADVPDNVIPSRGGTSGHVSKYHPQGTQAGSSGDLLNRDASLNKHLRGN